jgi:hypothetical protein
MLEALDDLRPNEVYVATLPAARTACRVKPLRVVVGGGQPPVIDYTDPVYDSQPPRFALLRHCSLGPQPPFIVDSAKFVLVRLHRGEHIQKLGEHVFHRLQLGFGDREAGEQGGLQTYVPTSSKNLLKQRFRAEIDADQLGRLTGEMPKARDSTRSLANASAAQEENLQFLMVTAGSYEVVKNVSREPVASLHSARYGHH